MELLLYLTSLWRLLSSGVDAAQVSTKGLEQMDMRDMILREIARVAVEQNKTIASLDDDVLLMDSGLDSLCFAILVARLEDQTGVDPFGASDETSLPTTVGELITFYDDFIRTAVMTEPAALSVA